MQVPLRPALAALLFMPISVALAEPTAELTTTVTIDRARSYGDELFLHVAIENKGAASARGTVSAGARGYVVDLVLSRDNRAGRGLSFPAPTVDDNSSPSEDPPIRDDMLLPEGRLSLTPDLAPGARHAFGIGGAPLGPFRLPAMALEVSAIFVCAVADPFSVVLEKDETDNDVCIALRP